MKEPASDQKKYLTNTRDVCLVVDLLKEETPVLSRFCRESGFRVPEPTAMIEELTPSRDADIAFQVLAQFRKSFQGLRVATERKEVDERGTRLGRRLKVSHELFKTPELVFSYKPRAKRSVEVDRRVDRLVVMEAERHGSLLLYGERAELSWPALGPLSNIGASGTLKGSMRRSFVLSVLTLVGTIIGAGVFALPHLFARLGTGQASLLFAVFVVLVAFTHAAYVDVVLDVKGAHRLPGYAKAQLGKRWGVLATMTHLIQVYGAHIIYLLLGSAFIQALMIPAEGKAARVGAMLLLWFLGATAVRGSLRRLASLEAIATTIMGVLFVGASAAVFVSRTPATTFVPHLTWSVFGVFLFALSGLPVVAEVVDLCERKRTAAKRATVVGTLLAGAVMWFFAWSFARAGGTLMTQDPRSLLSVLPVWGAWMVPLLGLLAIGTSYVTTAEDLQVTWRRDYGISDRSAWLITMVPPLIIALLMNDGFLMLATILGTVCGGLNGILVGMMRTAVAERANTLLAVVGGLVIVFIYTFGLAGQLASWLLI